MLEQNRLNRELRRLTETPSPDDRPAGMGTVRFVAHCRGDAPEVLGRASSILRTVNQHSSGPWPSEDRWQQLLPEWFVARCAPEETRQEAEAWLAWWQQLPPEAQQRSEREKPWSLNNWIYWFSSDQRRWYWWDAKATDPNTLLIAVEVDDWPFAWGALAWLLRAAGAEQVEAEGH